jgi:hypothetical protein
MARARPYAALWAIEPGEEDRLRSAIALARFALTSPDLTETHRRRLLREAIWYRTEGGGKYKVRYRSVGVLTLEDADVIKEWWKHLRHEHVVPRAKLVAEILAYPDRIEEVVRKAVACIVTPAEHDQLKPFDASHYGWERYLAASIDVYDMATGTLVIENGRYVNDGPVDRPKQWRQR